MLIGSAFGEYVQGELLLPLASLFPVAVLLGTGKGTNEPTHQKIKLNENRHKIKIKTEGLPWW